MKIEEFKSLREIHQYFALHNKCKLKYSATQPVYEIIPPKSEIVFIGEAPGLNEDKQGKPFVGAAGNLLNDLLKTIGLTREDIYVTNVVKYRPPNNREPLDEEKDACRIWVNAELIFLKPKVIVPMGKHALERFLPELRISLSHGQVYLHSSNTPIFAMYHPAVALYNPGLRNILENDFLKLKKFLEGKDPNLKQIEIPTKANKQVLIDEILKL